ncbi:MAG: hypothetical protein ACRDHW_05995, partial [Ktedonobacteraceae bacterium]
MEYDNPSKASASFQAHEVEQKLKRLRLLSHLIDAPVENRNDWQARNTCEELFCKIDDELRTAQIRFSYSKRAERYLRERYRMVEDGSVKNRVHGSVVCWTLIDTEANEGQGAPVLVAAPMTPKAVQAARTLGLPPVPPIPAFSRVPMYSREDRIRAQSLCECWNLAAAHLCPSCCQRFPEGDLPFEEEPYLNRAL